jgi:hypothetical protein
LIILVANPFIKINGNQFMMFNVVERRFNIFSFPFWPQDFYLFVLFMIVGVVFVILFTVIFGRIFCGWICPQTIFLEMVFRRIEYWIEGDRGAQIRLDKQEWNADHLPKANSRLIYMDRGDATLDAFYPPYQDKLDKLMKEKGWTKPMWISKVFPGAAHIETDWMKRLEYPVKFHIWN